MIEPAIRWVYAEDCSCTEGAVAHTGGCGLWLGKGCRDNRIEGNAVHDVAGNGLMAGEPTWKALYYRDSAFTVPPVDASANNVLANNHMHDCGAVFPGAVGIWLAFTDGAIVRHNLIHQLLTQAFPSVGCGVRPPPACAATTSSRPIMSTT